MKRRGRPLTRDQLRWLAVALAAVMVVAVVRTAPAAKDTLRAAFDAAKLPAEVEVYAGTKHGWCPTDSPVYDHDQAEKAWARALALFGKALST